MDKNNKRWFKAWSGNFPPGTPENDALSQIDTSTHPTPEIPQAQLVHAYYVPLGRKAHLDMACEHATRFQILRKVTGDGEYVVLADEVRAKIYEDSNVAAGSYDYKVIGPNSRTKGEASDPATVVAP